MANQWGRDASVQGGGSRSSFGLIVLFFLALFIGLAGGYGGFRFLSGVSNDELASRDERIAALEKTITDLRFNSDGAKTEQGALKQENDLLRARLAKANAAIETLRQDAGQQADGENQILMDELDKAQKENATLRRELQDSSGLADDLDKAKNSQRVAERQILDLEQQLSAADDQVAALKQQLAKQSDNLDQSARQQIKALTDQNTKLAAALAKQTQDATKARSALEDKVAVLTDQLQKSDLDLTRATADAAGKTQQLIAVKEERNALAKNVADLQGQLKDVSAQLAEAQNQANNGQEADKVIKDLQAKQKQLESKLAKANKSLADAQASAETLTAANTDLSGQVAALQKEVDSLKAQLAEAAANANPDNTDNPPADTGQPQNSDSGQPDNQARDPALVDRALSRMPSLDRLDSDKQAELRAKLEEGACVTDSLEAVFERVPVLALRNLMRDLKSPC